MLEAAEIGRKLTKEEYRQRVPALRAALVELQTRLKNSGTRVIIAISGDDRIGAGEVLAKLFEWLDPRLLRIEAFDLPTEEERERPLFWRYWRVLPEHGQIGVYLNAWTTWAIAEQIEKSDPLRLERRIRHITGFEQALMDDGALLLKFWIHLPKGAHKKRLRAAKRDPGSLWQVTDRDREVYQHYDDALPIVEQTLRLTSHGLATWEVIEAGSARYRDVAVAQALRDALSKHLDAAAATAAAAPQDVPAEAGSIEPGKTVLDTVDLTQELSEERYGRQLTRWQGRVADAVRETYSRGISVVAVFQGWDAAGKGGAIRRLTAAIPPTIARVVPIGAPSDEEREHHYLWRFWRRLQRAGHVLIFDRSWYERVLTERVEGFASSEEWRRAYDEINDFEEQLCEHGTVLIKYWLHIDEDEQLARFEAREQDPVKQYKITAEDYRNRDRWHDYELAVDEMVRRTNTPRVPWHLVAANDKRFARVEVLRRFAKRLEDAL